MLPQSYPNHKTVHRPFQAWSREEVLRWVLSDVANELRDHGALNEEERFIDATFVMEFCRSVATQHDNTLRKARAFPAGASPY